VILKRFLLKQPNLGENKHMKFVGDSGIPPPPHILALFKEKLRNEPNQFFFSNLALLSHASPFGTTYEVVTSSALA
jgi:hypothetical protein